MSPAPPWPITISVFLVWTVRHFFHLFFQNVNSVLSSNHSRSPFPQFVYWIFIFRNHGLFFLSSKSYFCTQNSFPEISFRELSEFSSISSISVTSVRVSYILVFRLGLSWQWQMREKSSTECCFHGSAESKLTNHKEMKKISVLLGSTGAQELKAIQLISTGPPRTTHIKWAPQTLLAGWPHRTIYFKSLS